MPAASPSRPLLLLLIIGLATPALAQPGWDRGGWDRGGWGRSHIERGGGTRAASGPDEREGKVEAAAFAAEDAAARLGRGVARVALMPGAPGGMHDAAAYEAAVIDQLVGAGYDTLHRSADAGQIAEIRIVRDVLVPAERKRKPVSGEVTVGASNHGSMMGMALALDLSKPRKALLGTRLEVRMRDQATGEALWEGRAEMATRDGDDRWTEQAIATRLAAALFEHFPATGAARVARR